MKKKQKALLDVLHMGIIQREAITLGVGKQKYQAYVTNLSLNQDCPGGVEEVTFKMCGPATEIDGPPDVSVNYVRKPI